MVKCEQYPFYNKARKYCFGLMYRVERRKVQEEKEIDKGNRSTKYDVYCDEKFIKTKQVLGIFCVEK